MSIRRYRSKTNRTRKNRSRKYTKKTQRKQRGGSKKRRLNKRGGGPVLPSEYFGKDSGRYFANPGSAGSSAYGKQVAVSHPGTNLGPSLHGKSTCTQTGGKRRSNRKSKRRSRRRSRK